MTPDEALTLLEKKLKKHGLASQGWTGVLDNAVRRFGACNMKRQSITVSRHLVTINSDEETLDTILHEIAHALALVQHGEDCGHDERWQAIAARIGARPERTVDAEETSAVVGSYYLIHRETGEVFQSFHKQPRFRDLSAVWIRGRRAETEGKLDVITARELALLQRRDQREDASETVRSFDRVSVKKLSQRLTAAITQVCDELGLTMTPQTGKFNPETYTCSYTISVPREQAEDGDQAEFELYCHLFGLQAEHFGVELTVRGEVFTLCGFKPQNRKYPVIGRDRNGKRFKFTAEVLDQVRRRSPSS